MTFQITSIADFNISDAASKTMLLSLLDGTVPFPEFKNALCLWGTYGTGKTTLASMLPSFFETSGKLRPSSRTTSLFASNDHYHLTPCGHSSNGVAVMQGIAARAASDVHSAPSGYFYEILDEVDLMTPAAQASLKAAITTNKNTIFILTTNHIQRIDAGVRDRSYQIEMNQPSIDSMAETGRRLLRQMQLTGNELPQETLCELAKASAGSMRDFCSAIATCGIRHGGVMP